MSVRDGAFSVKITDERYFAARRCVGPDAKVLQVGYMNVRSHHRRRKTRTFRTTCVEQLGFLWRTEQAELMISAALT